MKINIAIDGFSSCGKSTLAKDLAKALNYTYIDSGAMYRAITLYITRNDTPIDQISSLITILSDIKITFGGENNTNIFLNQEDVSVPIRTLEVASKVSEIAAIKEVREFAVAEQQKLGVAKAVVMDGRDIGTVVFPDAELKIFMTASEEVRVQRRFKEMQQTNPEITYEAVKENIAHRDYIDTTRIESPLVQAPDARILDNSNLNREEQLQLVLNWVKDIVG